MIDFFAWLSDLGNSVAGVTTLLGLLAVGITYSIPFLLPSPLRSLVGTWWTYGYFYHRGTDPVFYKERSTIHHFWLWPWVLRTISYPQSDDGAGALKYKGFCWYRSIYVYFQAYEPIYDDTTFEIYRRLMDDRHADDLLVGTHLGKSYDDMVFQASVVVMSRNELVLASAGVSEEDRRQMELQEFTRLAAAYSAFDDERGLLLIK